MLADRSSSSSAGYDSVLQSPVVVGRSRSPSPPPPLAASSSSASLPPPSAADKMGVSPVAQKWILTVFMMFNAWITPGGIIYGWPGLADMLKSEGQFADGCGAVAAGDTCSSQESKLGNIFAVGANVATVATIVYGFTLDRYGVRVNAFSGALLMCVGFVLLAFSDARPGHSFDAFIPGFSLVAFGGLGTYLPAFQFSALFERPTRILSLQSALFGVAGLTFTFFKFLADSHGVSRKTSFLAYAVLVAFCAVNMLLLYPAKAYKRGDLVHLPVLGWLGLSRAPVTPLDGLLNADGVTDATSYSPLTDDMEGGKLPSVVQGTDGGDALLTKASGDSADADAPPAGLVASPEELAVLKAELLLRDLSPAEREQLKLSRSLREEVLDMGTLLVSLHFSVGLLVCNFYNANIGTLLKDFGDADGHYTNAFVFITSVYPVLFSLSIDELQRRIRFYGMSFAATSLLILSTALLFTHSLPVQIFSFFVLGTGRALLITGMFSFVACQYRGEHYGRVVAFVTTICACIGLLQLALQHLLNGPANNQFDYFTAGMVAALVPLYAFSFWCWRRKI